jgi:hypothetical protein
MKPWVLFVGVAEVVRNPGPFEIHGNPRQWYSVK